MVETDAILERECGMRWDRWAAHRAVRMAACMAACVVTLGGAGVCLAQTGDAKGDAAAASQPLPLSAYLQNNQYSNASLSPDGKRLAVLAPIGEKRNLVVLDTATLKPLPLTDFHDFDVYWFRWVGPDWLVFSLGRLNAPTGPESGDGGGLYAIKADGSRKRELSGTAREQVNRRQYVYRGFSFRGSVRGADSDIYASGNIRAADTSDLYRINLETGRQELLTPEHPGNVVNWLQDRTGVPRLAVLADKADQDMPDVEQVRRVMLRDSVDAPWREIARFTGRQRNTWYPITFTDDNQDLIVSYRGQRDTSALYRYDVKEGKLAEMLVGHPRYDLGLDDEGSVISSFYRSGDDRLLGLQFQAETPEDVFFDEGMARLQLRLEKSFPGKKVTVQATRSDLMLVTTYSDRSPYTWYLYDTRKGTLRELLQSNTTLNERSLVAMRPFLLKTRDGLEIPSYYFLPASYQPGQKLPVVVHIHGGPMVRADYWGPNAGFGVREAQLLASRGYAVVLPNFRITPGFGRKIHHAGLGQYGRKMSEDHEDAALWAVAQGFADPKRICISGGSYGGAAALWATIKSADVFACAVAGMAPSDPQIQNTSLATDYVYSTSAVEHWKQILGVKGNDWSVADEVAPARHADRSRIPLFMYAGAQDSRVPLEQTRLMVRALERANRPPEVLIIKPDEGHGFGTLQNEVELYTEMLKFLQRHIGVGPTPTSASASTPASTSTPAPTAAQ